MVLAGLCSLVFLLAGAGLPVVAVGDDRLAAASLELLNDGRLTGSGSFVTAYGLALTAAHSIRGAHRLEVLSPEAGRLEAKVVATDIGHDLALLLVERTGGPFPALELAEQPPAVGESLQLFGSVLFRHGLRLPGTVAGEPMQFEWNSSNRCYTGVQAVAAMTPEGLSGGAWVNDDGRLVGVQSGMIVRQGNPVGVAFMAPLAAVQNLIAERQNRVTASLGAQFAESWEWSPQDAGRGNGPRGGVYILEILPGSPLALVGLKRGDLITKFNGAAIDYRDRLLALVRKLSPGNPVELTVLSLAGEEKQITVILADCGFF